MIAPLAAAVLVAVPPSFIVYELARRWPHRDPSAPKVSTEIIEKEVAKHRRFASLLRSRFDPSVDTGLLLTSALIGAAATLTAAGLLVRMIRADSGLATYDLWFAKWGSVHATAVSTTGLKTISLLGGYQFLVVATLGVAGLEIRRGMGKSAVWILLLVVGGQYAVVNTVKAIVDRERPNISQLTGFAGSSFPSGHSAAAIASYSVFSLLLGRKRSPRVKALLSALTIGIAVAVASSRVLLGVHWFTDVLGGLAVGWAWFTVVSMSFGGRVLRFGAPVAQAERVLEENVSGITNSAVGSDATTNRSGAKRG